MSATASEPVTASAIPLCRMDDLSPGIGRTFDVAGVRVAVFRTREGMILATDAACPHACAPLADGIVSGHCVVCPYHARRFDLRSGACDDGRTGGVRTYPVTLRADWVIVHL